MGLPHESTRRILLCVSGMTPQIITETLQELLRAPAAFVPTQIHVITTAAGESKARAALETKGQLAALCAQHGVATPPLDFTVIATADREPLTDIRDDTDNTLAADTILDCVRTLTQDADCAIHASLAGGRKTMSHYMGYAMSLFGRTQDRLSHVLVAPDWAERAADFYFKPTHNVELYDREGNALGPSDAVDITLADIPLLRLGDHLPDLLRKGPRSFSETVRLANLALAPDLVLDRHSRHIQASGIVIKLAPLHFAILHWLADRVLRGLPGFQASCIDDEILQDFLSSTRKAFVANGQFTDSEAENFAFYETAAKLQDQALDEREQYFSRHRTKLHAELKKHLGRALTQAYLAPKRGQPVGIKLCVEQIRFERIADTNAAPPPGKPAS